jgi:hypothetical protein
VRACGCRSASLVPLPDRTPPHTRRAANFRQEDTSFAAKLSAKERDIYYAAHEATTQFTQWRSGKEKQTATIHATSGKRKRHDA